MSRWSSPTSSRSKAPQGEDFLNAPPRPHPQFSQWIYAAKYQHPAPVLTTADLYATIEAAIAVDHATAVVIYDTICKVLATAIRHRSRVTLPGFGTFHRRMSRGKQFLRFEPSAPWWGWWMPVVAYDEEERMIGIWDGTELLPFGHPDNPYASPEQVPFVPDWSFRSATPMPGDPPPAPYPHPVRPSRRPVTLNERRDLDPVARRARRRQLRERKKLDPS